MAAIKKTLNDNLPVDTEWLNVETINSLHTESHWQIALQKHCQTIHEFEAMDRQLWLNEIKKYIAKNIELEQETLQIIINFSFLICDWKLLIETFKRLSSFQPDEIKSLVYAYWKSGDWNIAYDILDKQMLTHPNVVSFYDWHLDLIDLSNKQEFSFYSNRDISAQLKLEPLSFHHVDEYIWQYWDQDIAELCCLPKISSKQEWCDWFEYQQSLTDQINYAVLHETFGFIGVVSLIIHRRVSFFYFWIGKDFQGKGYGTEAVKLLLEIGEAYFGITCCYAKVFEHNHASKKSLRKIGFEQLNFNAAPPYDNEQLYYFGEDKCESEQVNELHQLLCDMKSDTKIHVPIQILMQS